MSARVPSVGVIAPRIGIVRSYPPRYEIVHENAPANHVYEVISGTVCTSKVLKNGRRQIAGFYFTGDVFGLETVDRYPLAAEAITKARIRVFKKQTLTALASSNGEVTHLLLALTARELARQQNLLLSLSRSAEDRIVYFIVEMIQRVPPKEGLIALVMSRQDIADYLGLRIETVSRILHDLERRGAIKIKGYRSIALRNQFVDGRAEELPDLFEGIKGHQPKTKQELDEWLVSPEGRAATIFNLMSYLDGEKERGPDEDHEDPTKSSRPLSRDTDVCFWHLADIPLSAVNVRFRGQSGHHSDVSRCLSYLRQRQASRSALDPSAADDRPGTINSIDAIKPAG